MGSLKSSYAASLSRNSFMPQHCVNSLESEELSRAQGDVQNVSARSHSDPLVVQRLLFTKVVEGPNVFCSTWSGGDYSQGHI